MSPSYDVKREQIKHAAIIVFGQYGYHKTTLDDIAQHIGIKKNSLYYYFSNKESLFNELIRDEADRVFDDIEKSISSGKSASQKIKVFVKKVIYVHKEKSNLYSITLKAFLEIGDVIEKSYIEFRKRAAAILEKILKEGVKTGEFKRHNTGELAEHLLTMMNSLEYKEFRIAHIESFDEIDFVKIEKTIINLTNFILAGLKCEKT